MVVTPEDFDNHSARIEEEWGDEISRRCCISRKYYYIFHMIREQNEDHSDSYFSFGPGDHAEASDFIQRVGYKNLADDLDTLRNDRTNADYDIDDSISEMDVAIFCNNLEDFIEEAKRHNFIS